MGANAGAVFQVASLFNCLESNSPGSVPADGLSRSSADAVQGAACARSCPAATVFRNYFVNGKGQVEGDQVDCLSSVGEVVGNDKENYWTMKNGYCMPYANGSIVRLSGKLNKDKQLSDKVRSQMRVGIHWETETVDRTHKVCQVFCSALPVGLVKTARAADWSAFAQIIL